MNKHLNSTNSLPSLASRARRGEILYGVMSSASDPMLAELMAVLGFDFYIIDCEHAPLGAAEALAIIRACECFGIAPVVRIGKGEIDILGKYLNSGVAGLMTGSLTSMEELARMVSLSRFAPQGSRGIGMAARSAAYLLNEDQVDACLLAENQAVLLLPEFERSEMREEVAAMANFPGVDGIVIGPRDLALSMTHSSNSAAPVVQQTIADACATIGKSGKLISIPASSRADASAKAAMGASLIFFNLQNVMRYGAINLLPVRSKNGQV